MIVHFRDTYVDDVLRDGFSNGNFGRLDFEHAAL